MTISNEYIEAIVKENKELLDRLGSDYDENGVPYWETESNFDNEFPIDKTQH